MTGREKAFYTTQEVAQILSDHIDRRVGPSYVRDAWYSAFRDHIDPGSRRRVLIPGRYIKWMKDHARINWHRRDSISFGDWLDLNMHRRPGVRMRPGTMAVVKTKQRKKEIAPSGDGDLMRVIDGMQERICRLERTQSPKGTPAKTQKRITGNGTTRQSFIVHRTAGFAKQYRFDYDYVWKWCHAAFQDELGSYDPEAFGSMESLISYVASTGLLDEWQRRMGGWFDRIVNENKQSNSDCQLELEL